MAPAGDAKSAFVKSGQSLVVPLPSTSLKTDRAVTPADAYLDYAATTPMRPGVLAAMTPFLSGTFGNPSGGHAVARAAKTALEEARETVAAALGARPGEVVFTAGGSEADNLAVKGAARAARAGRDAATASSPSRSSTRPCSRRATAWSARASGSHASRAGLDGIVDLDALEDALDDRTVLVSVMLVNNEVGTIQPLDAVARSGAARVLPARSCTPTRSRRCPGSTSSRATQPAQLVVDLRPQVRWPEGHRRARRARRRVRSSR